MRKFILLNVFCVITISAYTQDLSESTDTTSTDTTQVWKKGISIFINFSQTSLTNWAAGGQSSISGNGLINLYANYNKGNSNWDNMLDIGYGMLKQKSDDNPIKSDDKIDLTSKYGYKAFDHWNYAALLNFKTQMTNGYNYPDTVIISKFLAPGYILASAGLDYKPNETFSAFISPFTAKFTIVNDRALSDSGAFGIDRGKTIRSEPGGYIRIQYIKELFKNISLNTKAEFFSNYINNPQNIDVNWEMQLILKANKYVSTTISTQLLYDDDIDIGKDDDGDGTIDRNSPAVQFKEVLSVGLTVKF